MEEFNRYDRVILWDEAVKQEWKGLFLGKTQDGIIIYIPLVGYAVTVPTSLQSKITPDRSPETENAIAAMELQADIYLAKLEINKKKIKEGFSSIFYKQRRYTLKTAKDSVFDCIYLRKSLRGYYFFILADLPQEDDLGRIVVRPGIVHRLKLGDFLTFSRKKQPVPESYKGWLDIYFDIVDTV